MKEFLFLFHSTVGVIQTRKALQAAGMTFRVSDIPRDLRGGCGLCIWLTCPPGEEIQWVILGRPKRYIASRAATGSAWCITMQKRQPGNKTFKYNARIIGCA